MRCSFLLSILGLAVLGKAHQPFGISSSLVRLEEMQTDKVQVGRGGGSNKQQTAKALQKETNVLHQPFRGGSKSLLSWIHGLFSPSRLPYLIGFVLSLYYFLVFTSGEDVIDPFYKDGFCVTNLQDVGGIKKCPDLANSHTFAFLVDVVFTLAGFLIPLTSYVNPEKPRIEKIAIPFIIIFHGLLHGFLSSQQCYVPMDDTGLAETFYSTFTVALVGLMLGPFSSFSDVVGPIGTLLGIAASSYWIIQRTLNIAGKGENNAIAVLFGSTQLLFSATGAFFPKQGVSTKLVGQTFIFPVIVSLLEYSKCTVKGGLGLHNVGGHAWYDITLHTSVICSLLDSGDKGIIDYVKHLLGK